jgi:hypothetical protein
MPQVLFRQIKCKPINWQAFYDVIAQEHEDTIKPELLAWFEKIVAKWTHQPEFKAFKTIKKTYTSVNVYPVGENADIWRYVSGGTEPHLIPKSPLPYHLKFNWGGYGSYKPRTTTSGGYKGPGKVIGGTIHRPKQVHHPGNKARNFEKHIARWYTKRYRQVMKNAVARGLRKAQAR